ncbi:MAG: LytR/AlgR family response regulator transcription factor [Flavobacterium sp.]|uniref:LytR/AlgR family response regulator transcription factor n=1 Tax=Flavobacterium sp. TaxID=239 RepID=UPI003BD083E5
MNTIKCFIIDDQEPAFRLIEEYISKIPQLEIVGISNEPMEALTKIQQQHVDLLFLDINMPVLNGIQFLKTLKNPPNTIFTTAYSEYALQAFDLKVIDYLVKPIPFERFVMAVNRVFDKKNAIIPEITPAENEFPETQFTDFSFFKTNQNKLEKINFSEVIFIESHGEYARFHTKKKISVSRVSLNRLEEIFPKNNFFRVHRSFIINIHKIEAIDGNLIEIQTYKIPISKSRREDLNKLILHNNS